tara:strand:+ start:627 stop:1628 length:1002 start_codon:yes stop_codon:yes gene_type:complete
MKKIIVILFFVFGFNGFGQTEYNLSIKAESEWQEGNYTEAIRLYDSIISISVDTNNYYNYFDSRGFVKFLSKDFEGALKDINKSLSLKKTCQSMSLRGQIKLELNDRKRACSDWELANKLCLGKYDKSLLNHCDENWDYDKIMEVYYNDSSFTKYDKGDNIYRIRYKLQEKGNDWKLYYDKDFTKIMADIMIKGDTVRTIYYYSNGFKKFENKSVNKRWIYSAAWCENGQLKKAFNPNSRTIKHLKEYNCEGNIVMEYSRDMWSYQGLFIVYHKNGQIAEQGVFEKTKSIIGEQKVGLWEGFTPKGVKSYESFYENGIEINASTFKDGKEIKN